jgi:hypothetical protein
VDEEYDVVVGMDGGVDDEEGKDEASSDENWKNLTAWRLVSRWSEGGVVADELLFVCFSFSGSARLVGAAKEESTTKPRGAQ